MRANSSGGGKEKEIESKWEKKQQFETIEYDLRSSTAITAFGR